MFTLPYGPTNITQQPSWLVALGCQSAQSMGAVE
jgi:hypothetical protein